MGVPQAIEEFKQTVFKLFGEHEDPQIYLCHKQTQNTKPVYMGTGAALMDMLRTSEDIRKQLDIVAISEPDGFTCKWVNGKKEEGEKVFHMTLNEQFALYTKQGWETMACAKLRHQFDSESTLGSKVDFPTELPAEVDRPTKEAEQRHATEEKAPPLQAESSTKESEERARFVQVEIDRLAKEAVEQTAKEEQNILAQERAERSNKEE